MTTLENNPLRDLNNARNLPRNTSLLQHFDLEELVHSSFRYFLGRRTISTCAFARNLAAAWPLLSQSTRVMIGRELAHAYAEAARYPERQPLGADCDREAWDAVRDAMEETK
jgi:hypothetical protein